MEDQICLTCLATHFTIKDLEFRSAVVIGEVIRKIKNAEDKLPQVSQAVDSFAVNINSTWKVRSRLFCISSVPKTAIQDICDILTTKVTELIQRIKLNLVKLNADYCKLG